MRARSATLVALLALAALLPANSASAQVQLEVRLLDFPLWVGPEDGLRAVLEVTNRGDEPVNDLRVALAIHEGLPTRSHLMRSFTGQLGGVIGIDTIIVRQVIEPGASTQILVDKPLKEVRFFQSQPEDRAYPVRFTVRVGNVQAPPVDTHMIFFSRPAPTPLELALVIPLHAPSIYSGEGRVASSQLERFLQNGGGGSLLEAIEANPESAVTLAPSGLLIDTLGDLADGYSVTTGQGAQRVETGQGGAAKAQGTLDRIKAIASRQNVRLITTPYAMAHLPWLVQEQMDAQAERQVREGTLRLKSLGVEPAPGWLLPTYAVVDDPTLSLLLRSGVTSLVLSRASVKPRAREPALTAPAPVQISGRPGTTVLLADAGLEARLVPPREISPTQARQRFLAETATIMEERPAQRRPVVAVAPVGWSPDPLMLNGILLALSGSPWMTGATVEAAASVPAGAAFDLASPEAVVATAPEAPSEPYASDLRNAAQALEEYSELEPPAERMNSIKQRMMIAESADWWSTRRVVSTGRGFALSVTKEVEVEFGKIRAPVPQTITLTSQTGVIPLVISTSTDYAVRVSIRLDSDKLQFPGGALLSQRLLPPAQTIDVQAVTEASGTFPVRVIVQTPKGRQIDSSQLIVRSTAYNAVAVGITLGAGLFLIGWWIVGGLRSRVIRKTAE
jgi:hypothetical protein